jgi:hypothetical protein
VERKRKRGRDDRKCRFYDTTNSQDNEYLRHWSHYISGETSKMWFDDGIHLNHLAKLPTVH